MKPSVGRIVLYRTAARIVPAIITKVSIHTLARAKQEVTLTVFPPHADPVVETAEFSDDPEAIGTWFWPPRVE